MLINSIITFCLIVSFLYAGLILLVIIISILGTSKNEINDSYFPSVSLIIPFRNEAKNLHRLCQSLELQNYSSLEILFVDDHSSDNSSEIIDSWNISKFQIKKIKLSDSETGKKTAIEKGISASTNDRIICLDADCIPNSNNWVLNLVNKSQNCDLFGGPVYLEKSSNIWTMIQSVEMFATQLVSFGMSKLKSPIAISGANLSYSKKNFLEVNPYSTNKNTASGDDIYFLQSIKKRKQKIRQEIDLKFAVNTNPISFNNYFQQRMRWMRKSSSFHDLTTILVGLLIFFSVIIFLFGAVYQIIMQELNSQLLISMGVKMGIDFLLLFLIAVKFKRMGLLMVFIPAFLFNIFAFSGVILLGWFIPVKWKNRKI